MPSAAGAVETPPPPAAVTAIAGTAALAVEPAPAFAPAPSLTGQDLFVVHSGSGRTTGSRKPLKVIVAGVVALVAAFGGYKAVGGVFGGDEGASVGGGKPAGGLPAAAAALQRVFRAGEQNSYQMSVTVDATMTSPEAGKPETVDVTAVVSFTEKVVSKDASGTTNLRYTIDRARIQAQGQSITLPISGAGVDVRVGKNGKVLASTSFGKGVDDLPDENFYELLMPVLKPGAKVGDSWTSKDTAQIPGLDDVELVTTYRMTKRTGNQAVIHSTAEAPFDLALSAEDLLGAFGGSAPAGGPKTMQMKGRLIAAGDQTVDIATGRTISGTGKGTMNAIISIDGREVMRMSMRIAMTLTPAVPTNAV